LKENEESLLVYGNEEDDDDGDEEVEGLARTTTMSAISSKESEQRGEASHDSNGIHLTSELLERLGQGAFESHGIKNLRKIVYAFKSACRLDDDESNVKGQKYVISSEVFDQLMVLSFTRCCDEFNFHLLQEGTVDSDFDPNKPIALKTLERSPRWEKLKSIVFTFLKAAIHILSEAKEPELRVFVLKAFSNYIPFMTAFPRLAESMLKLLTSLWSAPLDSSEDYQVVRLHSFLRIRQLALTQPFPFIEDCLKKLYLAYAQRAKFATASSETSVLPTITFMGNCVVEMYSLDYHSSYQHAFIYIRQLALHLRTATQKKTPEAVGAVYSWQFLHCLKLWVAVLTEACQPASDEDGFDASLSNNGEDQLLRSLVFPLSQIIIGATRLVPSARYLPFRLHCVRLLQQLAAGAEVFIPTTPILLEVFDLPELSQPIIRKEKNNVQPITLTLKLRADNPLRTIEEAEMCISELFNLLNRELELYRYSAGFPEFALRIGQRLKKVRFLMLRQ
jgi:nucleolar complex protein 2